jgi:hypothetical protein
MKRQSLPEGKPFATSLPARINQVKTLWFCTFFLHAILDPFITYLSIGVLGIGYESNPFLREWLNEGIGPFVLIHIPLLVIAIVGFLILRWFLSHGDESEQTQVYYLSVLILGGAIIWGGLVVINNLWVLWSGL